MTEIEMNQVAIADDAEWEKLSDAAKELCELIDPTDRSRADFLRFASAALELAGEKVEYEDRGGERYRARWYKSVGIEVFQVDRAAPTIEINGQRPGLKDIARFVDALLHAARTAREWASEGGES
jgi:hypothetical protein